MARQSAFPIREDRLHASYFGRIIAAVAATQDLILVTRNLADFEGYEGLAIESWFEG